MSTIPLISVVTSVYNGERYLRRSIESVLSQEGVDFEMIVVDDGSTDASGRILTEIAAGDSRLRILRQENRGLTAALIRGCSEARGRLIARHDSDDSSLPGRLEAQSRRLLEEPETALVSCWSLALGPRDETLLEIVRPDDDAAATRDLVSGTHGPAGHGSVMFRAEQYRRAGGYRDEFRFGQDWDLWLRLTELGRLAFIPRFLYAFRVLEHSISARRRNQQEALGRLARLCRAARDRGEPETQLLEKAREVSAAPGGGWAWAGRGSYFIGKCLFDRRDRRAIPYLRRSVALSPWNLRMWGALGAAAVLCRERS